MTSTPTSPHPLRELVHVATDDGEGFCPTCGLTVRKVPGGAGTTYVHPDGAVAGRTPAYVLALRALVADWQQRASELSPERPEGWENDPEDEVQDTIADTYADLAGALAAVLDGSAR